MAKSFVINKFYVGGSDITVELDSVLSSVDSSFSSHICFWISKMIGTLFCDSFPSKETTILGLVLVANLYLKLYTVCLYNARNAP